MKKWFLSDPQPSTQSCRAHAIPQHIEFDKFDAIFATIFRWKMTSFLIFSIRGLENEVILKSLRMKDQFSISNKFLWQASLYLAREHLPTTCSSQSVKILFLIRKCRSRCLYFFYKFNCILFVSTQANLWRKMYWRPPRIEPGPLDLASVAPQQSY